MLRHPDYTRKRIAQLVERFSNRIYPQTLPSAALAISPRVERIPYSAAVKLKYRPVRLGARLGPLFATYWFHVRVHVPQEWKGWRVDLLWDTHSEGTLWMDGRSIQGLNHSNGQDRLEAPLLKRAQGGEKIEFYIETACNDMFGNGGNQWPAQHNPIFLDRCEIGRFDPLAWELYHDLRVLSELEKEQVPRNGGTALFEPPPFSGDLDAAWAGMLLFELNRFANAIDEDDRATWPKAHRILQALFKARNATVTHELSALGHAHIDTAWLWPLAETTRKCTRTFSTQTSYMDDYPAYKFACSQAYQYQTIKDVNPDLYKRIKAKVKTGQWVPVGGTWVEPDCNIPSGEALLRQFLFGQRFFEKEFGCRCQEFWNPDVFGYNGQLPQIMRLAGIKRFLTQKLSWNHFNKPMHQTFHWQGIDGSQVLAHFPPVDTYNGNGAIAELRRHARQYKDNDRSRHALYLFGYGDGGGGPTRQMLETFQRVGDLQGVPRSALRSSNKFFDLLEADIQDVPVVVGELYLEFHRGTYTTQAATKRNNRKSEFLLHDIEFLAAVAERAGTFKYPRSDLDEMWRTVLLHQFHDILPGSSIRLVYEDADRYYAQVFATGQPLRDQAAQAFAALSLPEKAGVKVSSNDAAIPINTISFNRQEVVQQPNGRLVFIEAPSYGTGLVVAAPSDRVAIIESANRVILENTALKAVLSADGRVLSLIHKTTGREALAEPANVFELFDDQPTAYDAWDVDPWLHETAKPCPPATSCKITRRDALRAEVTFTRRIGRKSALTQSVRLDAGARRLEFHCDVDWRESKKMLKVKFPVGVRAMNAAYEMQFGSVERPTHCNDSIALARYEVPGHKWADLSEPDFGVALLNESKYGFSTRGQTIYLSLLRSTTAPDPQADIGKHHFAYALYPHEGAWQQGGVVAEAFRFNVPVLWAKGAARAARSFFGVDNPALVLDTVKKAEDSAAVIVRLYEAHGSRGAARLQLGLPFKQAVFCNALEDDGQPVVIRGGHIRLDFGPYQIITLKLR